MSDAPDKEAAEQRIEEWVEGVNRHLGTIQSVSTGLCDSCYECEDSSEEEEEFSRESCDSCGTSLAGSRSIAHGLDEELTVYHLAICRDCVMFHAYGDVPDLDEQE